MGDRTETVSHGVHLRARERVGPSPAHQGGCKHPHAGPVHAPVGPSQGAELPRAPHPGSVPEEERRKLEPFGTELRTLRKEAGLSQKRLGDLAGLRGDHLGRLERAQRRPTVGAIKALAGVLAPDGERDALEQRLAGLAGSSLREGAERKKQRRENRQRRLAVRELQAAQSKIVRAIRRKEERGELVPGPLRRLAEQNAQTLERLKATAVPDPEPIRGYAPLDMRTRSGRLTKVEVLSWALAGHKD